LTIRVENKIFYRGLGSENVVKIIVECGWSQGTALYKTFMYVTNFPDVCYGVWRQFLANFWRFTFDMFFRQKRHYLV